MLETESLGDLRVCIGCTSAPAVNGSGFAALVDGVGESESLSIKTGEFDTASHQLRRHAMLSSWNQRQAPQRPT